MSVKNNIAVTVRFTNEEYRILKELVGRYGGTEKTLLKFAFAMLAESTGKLETRIQENPLWDSKITNTLPQESSPSPESQD